MATKQRRVLNHRPEPRSIRALSQREHRPGAAPTRRVVSFLAGTLLLLASAGIVLGEKTGTQAKSGRDTKSTSFRSTTPGGLSGLALPNPYVQHIEDRLTIDVYQREHRVVAPGILPAPRPRYSAPARVPHAFQIVPSSLPPGIRAFRETNGSRVLPPRGFWAPILDNASELWLPRTPSSGLSPAEAEAARLIESRLAVDGLLPTLARAIHQLGAENCLTNTRAACDRLFALGYPVDLLHHFRPGNPGVPAARPIAIVESLARRILGAPDVAAALKEPFHAVFDFQPTSPGLSWIHQLPVNAPAPESSAEATIDLTGRFELATESGEHEIGLLRLQVGGGWRDGVIPGGSLDVIDQMVNHFRSADFLVGVDEESSGPYQSLITNTWRLRRQNQVTLFEIPVEPSAWAQDNGKAGVIAGAAGLPSRVATLVPRYACTDEGKSVFLPAESYLADGLRAAGHTVIHSPLLFQGGNLLGIREPRTARRLLVLGESTLWRNMALGLSRPQALQAFKSEFGVDDCIVLPVVSYHLDFDVSFRNSGRELIAFVNDTPRAARHIVDLGLSALQRHGLMAGEVTTRLRADLAAQRDQPVVIALANLLRVQAGTNLPPATLSRAFAGEPSDDATGNLQVFLLAIDLLESALAPAHAVRPDPDPANRTSYLGALRRMEDARRRQIAALQQLGCKIVPIPSMHDLYRSINYLNGLQHRGGYAMPAYGGFYSPLDQAALAAFHAELGPESHITTIFTSECQRMHGGVHCTASVYPRL